MSSEARLVLRGEGPAFRARPAARAITSALPEFKRRYWLFVAALTYVCLGAARTGGGLLPWLALAVLPVLLWEVFRRTEPRPGDDRSAAEARGAARAAFWGAAMLVAARTGAAGEPALDAAANLGAGVAAAGSLVTLARLPASSGLLLEPRSARSLDAAIFTGFLWGIATALPATHAILPASTRRFDPLLIDYATTSAGLGSLLVMAAATLRLRFLRRLELGVGDRARSASAVCITAFLVAVPASWLDVAAPDRVLPAAVAISSGLTAWAATTGEATLVTRLLRGALAVTILGAPLLIAATLLTRYVPSYAPAVALISGLLAVGVGIVARNVARPLGPEQSRWLSALDQAARDALQPEPSAALRAALVALGKVGTTPEVRAEIWQRDPAEVLSVDVAGYLHTAHSEAPERLYELGAREPERTLRADVLQSLSVRRPEVRGLIAWFEARAGYSATLIVDDDGPIGFVLLPRAARTSPLTLEEARAARLLADRISSLLAVASALSRSREREVQATRRADAVDDECRRLEHIIGGSAERNRAHAVRLARPALTSAFSAAAREALSELERLGKLQSLLALVVPPGTDAVAFGAHFHLSSPNADGPFVVSDAATPEEQSEERWSEQQRSPLSLADGGTLLILNVLALAPAAQEALALALSRRAAHAPRSGVLPPAVVLALPRPVEQVVQEGRLSGNLARWVKEAELSLPRLRDRSEDLRALVLRHLALSTVELGKDAIGIDTAALRMLVEHGWPGNEAELSAVLQRAASGVFGRNLSTEDLERSGFKPEPVAIEDEPEPLPRAPRRRASSRAPRAR